jgi:hypothetical protein
MQIELSTTPIRLPMKMNRSRPLIQNLGPGNIFIDTDNNVSMATGFLITPGSVYEFPVSSAFNRGIWMVSDHDQTDVRVISLG